jgi:hypothetical protein
MKLWKEILGYLRKILDNVLNNYVFCFKMQINNKM